MPDAGPPPGDACSPTSDADRTRINCRIPPRCSRPAPVRNPAPDVSSVHRTRRTCQGWKNDSHA
ncbi:hypothetical protein ACFFX0_19420 [Citricoccus parietis]|uniref:Uncharacterized protein n=1 Tax=Citricoccus parietis TaxID=592307 RepID=A0ABV5G2T5_9MICC